MLFPALLRGSVFPSDSVVRAIGAAAAGFRIHQTDVVLAFVLQFFARSVSAHFGERPTAARFDSRFAAAFCHFSVDPNSLDSPNGNDCYFG
jgi:hypothetical protein